MYRVFPVPGCALQHPFKPATGLRKIAFTGQGPPCQRAAESGEDTAAPRTLPKGLNSKRPAANADQQPREGEALGCAVPAASVPDAGGSTVGG